MQEHAGSARIRPTHGCIRHQGPTTVYRCAVPRRAIRAGGASCVARCCDCFLGSPPASWEKGEAMLSPFLHEGPLP